MTTKIKTIITLNQETHDILLGMSELNNIAINAIANIAIDSYIQGNTEFACKAKEYINARKALKNQYIEHQYNSNTDNIDLNNENQSVETI